MLLRPHSHTNQNISASLHILNARLQLVLHLVRVGEGVLVRWHDSALWINGGSAAFRSPEEALERTADSSLGSSFLQVQLQVKT